jgi:transglutaminase-like putative cysteine protease
MNAADTTGGTHTPNHAPEGPGFWGWISILSGLLPFMVLWNNFFFIWILALAFMIWGRRQARIPYSLLLLLTFLSGLPGLWLYSTKKDSIGSFGLFLVLASCVTLAGARKRQEHRVPFLLGFILLMATGHRTLEIFYLIPVFLFFTGYALARVGEAAEKGSSPPRYRTTALLMGLTCLLAVPIFLFMPRTRMSVMALVSRASLSGFGGAIRFGQMGEMQLSDRLVMRVRTRTAGYMRGMTLDAYNRSGWRNTYKGTRTLSSSNEPLLRVARNKVGPGLLIDPSPDRVDAEGYPRVQPDQGIYTQDVILESFEQGVLFTSGHCLAVYAPGQTLAATTPGDITRGSEETRNEKLIYRAYSQRQRASQEELARVLTVEKRGGFLRRYQQLPDNFPQRVRDLARKVTQGETALQGKCQALVKYLQGNFTYSLQRTVNSDLDPVEDLLFGDPRGHCEYFASAMATMLRCLKVNTRVVIGFTTGDFNRYSQTFTIRERDAHSWVEVYFGDTYGWIPFDPTPDDPNETDAATGSSDLTMLMSAGLDQLDAWWQNKVVNYYFNEGGPAIESWLYRLDDFLVDSVGLRWLRYPPDNLWKEIGQVLAKFVAALLLLWGLWREGGPVKLLQSLLSWLWKLLSLLPGPLKSLGKSRRTASRGEAGRIYQRWLQELATRDLPRAPSATPREFLAELRTLAPQEVPRGEILTQAYEAEEFAEEIGNALLEQARKAFSRPSSVGDSPGENSPEVASLAACEEQAATRCEPDEATAPDTPRLPGKLPE